MAELIESLLNGAHFIIPSPDAFLAKRVGAVKVLIPEAQNLKGDESHHPKLRKSDKSQTDQNSNTPLLEGKGECGQNTQTREFEKLKENLLLEGVQIKMAEQEKKESELNSLAQLLMLEDLRRRERLFFWHSISLSGYFRTKKIPRALRVLQTGLKGVEMHPELAEKFNAVTDKCSFDLMLLTLDQAAKDREQMLLQISVLEEALQEQVSQKVYRQVKKELDVKIAAFEKNLRKIIEKKCKRDQCDYINGRVYTWRHQGDAGQNSGSVSLGCSSDSDECPDEQSSSRSLLSSSASLPATEVKQPVTEVKPRKKTKRGRRGKKKKAN